MLTFFTANTFTSRRTDAAELANAIYTCTPKSTRIRSTFININSAIWPCKSWCTFTQEPVNPIYTFPTIKAWWWITVIYVMLAVLAFKTFFAYAWVEVTSIDTCGTILARIRFTCMWFGWKETREISVHVTQLPTV
jgi:hypothetical protein